VVRFESLGFSFGFTDSTIANMPNKKKTVKKTVESAESLKSQIDDERRQLDRLDAHGSSPVAEGYCRQRLTVLLARLKKLHGIDY
jgi:hypothetical protein